MQSLPFAVLWGGAVRSRDADKCAARRNKSFRGYGYYNNGSEGITLTVLKVFVLRAGGENEICVFISWENRCKIRKILF
jgi:hypothetical protein